MIYISQDQLEQVEYIIDQSILGHHVLFDHEILRKIFTEEKTNPILEEVSEEDAYQVEHHIEKLILQPSLAQKKAYLEKLDPTTFIHVVRTYFNIVENNLFENQELPH